MTSPTHASEQGVRAGSVHSSSTSLSTSASAARASCVRASPVVFGTAPVACCRARSACARRRVHRPHSATHARANSPRPTAREHLPPAGRAPRHPAGRPRTALRSPRRRRLRRDRRAEVETGAGRSTAVQCAKPAHVHPKALNPKPKAERGLRRRAGVRGFGVWAEERVDERPQPLAAEPRAVSAAVATNGKRPGDGDRSGRRWRQREM